MPDIDERNLSEIIRAVVGLTARQSVMMKLLKQLGVSDDQVKAAMAEVDAQLNSDALLKHVMADATQTVPNLQGLLRRLQSLQ